MFELDKYSSIYMSIKGRMAGIVSRIAPPKDVEDIVQESYVKLCLVKKKSDIKDPAAFLMTSARNLALDHIKRAESRLTSSIDESDDNNLTKNSGVADETFEKVASDEEFALFCEAVRKLPVQCRRAFVLKKVYGYSQREIAMQLKLSESTIEKHIALGIKRCTYFMIRNEETGHISHQSAPRISPSKGGLS